MSAITEAVQQKYGAAARQARRGEKAGCGCEPTCCETITSDLYDAAQAAHQGHTYAYLFTWPSPTLGGMLGACHALDLPFVFGTLAHPMFRPFAGKGPEARALAQRMQDAWIAFART